MFEEKKLLNKISKLISIDNQAINLAKYLLP